MCTCTKNTDRYEVHMYEVPSTNIYMYVHKVFKLNIEQAVQCQCRLGNPSCDLDIDSGSSLSHALVLFNCTRCGGR